MSTYFQSQNISRLHFSVTGRTNDIIINEALERLTLQKALHAHLSNLKTPRIPKGYERIVFFERGNVIHFLDSDSKARTESIRALKTPPPPSDPTIKIGPLGGVSTVATTKEEPSNSDSQRSNSNTLGRMDNNDIALQWLNDCMKDTQYKTALIIDAAYFLEDFRSPRGQRGHLDSRIIGVLEGWERNAGASNDNIVIWVFGENFSVDRRDVEGGTLWRDYFSRMLSDKLSERKGTRINISTPQAGEIKNIINNLRIRDGIRVDFTALDEITQMLEKKAKGQMVESDAGIMCSAKDIETIIIETHTEGGVTMQNIEKVCGKRSVKSAMERLNELSGLDDFKKFIKKKEEEAQKANLRKGVSVEYNSRIEERPINYDLRRMNLHLAFKGNPGTGKTTIAKLLGEIYKELGILPVGSITKVTRADLVAAYQGQTALKTRERINDAIGGILFLDEAYALVNGENDSYGKEARDTLLEAMTDRMGEFAVVIAGYPNEIEQFVKSNPGFSSRFATQITLEDYSPSVLADIFAKYLRRHNVTLSTALSEKLVDFMERYHRDTPPDEWANARTAENLAEGVISECQRLDSKVADVSHLPVDMMRYFEASDTRSEQARTLKKRQLILPQAVILSDDGEVDIKKAEQSVLFLTNRRRDGAVSYGTGFLISPYGHFITCHHVIDNASELIARLRIPKDGDFEDRLCRCEIMKTSAELDIALIKIEETALPYLSLENSRLYHYDKGKNVCLFGYPLGDQTAESCTYNDGKIETEITDKHGLQIINIDIRGRHGNSGGPVIDMKTGNVIGIFKGSILGVGVDEINQMRPISYFWDNFVV